MSIDRSSLDERRTENLKMTHSTLKNEPEPRPKIRSFRVPPTRSNTAIKIQPSNRTNIQPTDNIQLTAIMADTKKDTSSKRWYLQDQNRERYAGISADGTIPEVDREALHRLISVKLAATGFEVPETSGRDEGVMQLASDLFRQYAEQVSPLKRLANASSLLFSPHILCRFLATFRLAGSRSFR